MNDTLSDAEIRSRDWFRVSTDIVIFTIRDDALQVLLRPCQSGSEAATSWALPGDYVGVSESLDACAVRTLSEQTGIRKVYLEQLYSFGQPDRHPGSRVVSVAYYALACEDQAAGFQMDRPDKWWRLDRLPEMHLDHRQIACAARERLVAKLDYSTVAFQLMPECFTLSELQQVYETIRGRPMDKRNFRKRALAMEHIESTGHKRRNGSHRPARLYRYTARDAIHYLK